MYSGDPNKKHSNNRTIQITDFIITVSPLFHNSLLFKLFWVAHDIAVLWTKLCSFGNLVLKKATSKGITNLFVPLVYLLLIAYKYTKLLKVCTHLHLLKLLNSLTNKHRNSSLHQDSRASINLSHKQRIWIPTVAISFISAWIHRHH